MVSKIFHLSDIHIRVYKRHEEYKNTFDRLFGSIENNKDDNSICIVTGDIVHSKINTSAEMFDLLRYFLDSLSDIVPTYIILGNHDMNLKNKNRLDPITPVVDSLNKDGLTILKGTEVHTLKEGLEVSLLDVVEGSDNFQPCSSIKSNFPKIAAYHGIVQGAMVSTGFVLDGEVDPNIFNGFDATLLGDVHKYQEIQKNMLYPGSLIQQNFGEHPVNHGYVVWEFGEHVTHEFVPVYNEHSYLVLDMEKEILDLLEYINFSVHEYTKSVSLSFRNSNKVSMSVINDIFFDISRRFEVKKKEIQNSKQETLEIDINDIEDYSFSNRKKSKESIVSYIDSKFDISPKYLDIVKDKVNSLVEDYDGWSLSNTSNTQIKEFKFRNMFSYGPKDITINFDSVEGLVGIFAENASGKSTFFDSLVYTIFGKCSRTSKASEVMNSEFDSFYSQVILLKDSKEYKIEKEGKRSSSGRVSVSVNLYSRKRGEDKYNLINGQDRRYTEKIIKDIFGSYDDFIHTSFFTQSNSINFIDMGQAKRKELLSYYLNLDLFYKWYDNLKSEYKKYNNIIEYEDPDQYPEKINKFSNDSKQYSQEIEENKNQLEKLSKEIKEKLNHIESLKILIKKVDPSINLIDPQNIERKIKNRKLSNKDMEDKKDTVLKKISTLSENLNKIEEAHFEVMESPKPKIDLLEQEIKSSLEKSKIYKKHIDKINKDLKYYDNLEYDPDCEYCVSNLNIDRVKDLKKEKDKYYKNNIELEVNIQSLRKDLESHREDFKIYKRYKSAQDKKYSIYKNIEFLRSSVVDLSEEIENNLSEINEYREKLKKYKDNKESIINNKEIKKEIKSTEEEYSLLLSKKENIKDDIVRKETILKSLKDKLKETEKKKKELEDIQDTSNSIKYLLKATHRDGLPLSIMSNALPFLENMVNSLLSDYVPFKVKVVNNGKNIDVLIDYNNGVVWDSSLTSGMEKFLLSLSFKVALNELTTLNKFNMLIIDEGFGSLDFENRTSIDGFLNNIKRYYNSVFCISHIDSMKDFMDMSMVVEKLNNLSNIYLDT